jgi:hypothetical protein
MNYFQHSLCKPPVQIATEQDLHNRFRVNRCIVRQAFDGRKINRVFDLFRLQYRETRGKENGIISVQGVIDAFFLTGNLMLW